VADFLEGIKEPRPPRRDLWYLPRILQVEAVLKRYRRPRVIYEGPERMESKQGVEILVKTSGPFPARALSPVLYVGDEPLNEWETAGENTYRFFAVDPSRLKEGAPLALGWPDDLRPRREAKQRFRLDKPGGRR
jgi:hypothetical protein